MSRFTADVEQKSGLGFTAQRRLQRAAERSEHWLGQRGVVVLGVLAALIAFAKSGISGLNAPVFPLASWPEPVNMYPFNSYGFRILGRVLNIESTAGYALMGAVLIIATVLLAGLLFARTSRPDVARLLVMIVLSGPVVWVLTGRIVHTDAFVILGGIVLGTVGTRLPWAAVGALLTILGGPEQAVVLSLGLYLLSVAPAFRHYRRGAAVALGMSAFGWVALSAWSRAMGVPDRAELFLLLWKRSVSIFFVQIPLQLYAGFALSLLVILWSLADQRRRDALIVIVAALGIPLAMTALTTDQSRVLVCVSIATTTAILVRYGPSFYDVLRRTIRYPLAVTAGVAILLPALELTGNFVRVPWEHWYPFFQAYIVDQLPTP